MARPAFLLLDADNRGLCGPPGSTQVEEIAVDCPRLHTTVSGFRAPAQDAQTIRLDAKMLFVAGAGWTKKQPDGQTHAAEAGELILGFLRTTSASLGSSKSWSIRAARKLRASLPHPHESDRADRRDAAPRQGTFDLLPRRGAARRRLALYRLDGGRSRSIPTAAGRAARPTSSMSPMPSK